jgi:glycosyltransferase involved in cell wall biosynthesis
MKKNINIAYDYQIFGGQRYGGISRYFFELARNIGGMSEVNATIVSPLYINSYLKKTDNSFNIIGRKMPIVKGAWRIYRLYNERISPSKIALLKPDIVHETYYSNHSSVPKNAKSVITVYDMIHELYPSAFLHSDNTRELKADAIKRADHVICISKKTQLDLINYSNIKPEKTSVIYLGVQLCETGTPVCENLINRPYLLYVGSRGGYKNFKTTLEMYGTNKHLRDAYDFVCFGGGRFNTTELELIKKLNIPSDKVIYKEGEDSKLVNLYKNASVFIYPSWYEGFGMPPLEAMSFGCPVACSDGGAMPEVLDDAAEFFNPCSTESMAHAIEKIIDNCERRNELITRGFARVSQFSWAKCAQETLNVYTTLI